MDVTNIVQTLGIVSTLIISVWTLIESQKDSKARNIVGIMVHKRSARIDELRRLYSQIITYSKCLLISDSKTSSRELKEKLIYSVNRFVSHLQYQYEHDIELIDMAKELESRFAITDNFSTLPDTAQLISDFWTKCDLYIGTEHERLKKESLGSLPGSGEIAMEENEFNSIYDKLAKINN